MNTRILRHRPTSAAIITLVALNGAANAQSVLSARLIAALPEMQSLHAVGVAGSGSSAAVAYQALHLDGSSSVGLHGPSGFTSLPGSPSSGASLSQFRAADWSWGLSQSGSMAGSSGAGQGRATLWTLSSGSPPELHLLDDTTGSMGGTLNSVASCVSLDAGLVFGSVVSINNGAVNSRAVSWARSGLNYTKIEMSLGDGFDSSSALACDVTGTVVGGFVGDSSTGRSRAALWTAGSLHVFDGPDNDCDGRFVAISDDGSSLLYRGAACDADGLAGRDRKQSIFRPSVGEWLTLPGSSSTSETLAGAMSGDARVVGGSVIDADGSSHATFWTLSNDAYLASDLASVLAMSSFADQFASLSLRSITGVSSDGLTFVGDAIDSSGRSSIFMVTVPTPGALALLGMGGLMGVRRQRP